MKRISLISILLIIAMLASSCAKEVLMDKTGKYVLSETGEAIIDDVSFSCDEAFSNGHSRVFYQIFVGSFSDSDGDGTGDLRGIISKLDYLNDGDPKSGRSLGIEGIWLSPIFESPSYHKYDVADYYKIDSKFGTEDDLADLLDECHKRGIIVILDVPINHTSKNHINFIRFLNAHRDKNTDSPYYEYYSYSQTVGSGGKVYSKIDGTSEYYEANFGGDMPEPNFDNPAVREDMLNVCRHYLEIGADGFRFDAAKYIYYGEENRNAEFWDWYIGALRKVKPDIYTVSEVWASDSITLPYYSSGECFNFSVSQQQGLLTETARKGNVNIYTSYVESYIGKIEAKRDGAVYVPFLSNHDMDRSAGYLTAASGFNRVAANLYILGPGSPFIYYGEEIGMKGSRGSANTDANRRLAMLWGDGDTVRDPIGTTYDKESQTNGTVASQIGDGGSIYSYYKRLIMIRKANPEIANGEYTALHLNGSDMGGFISTLDGKSVCVIHNTTGSKKSYDLSSVTDVRFAGITAIIGASVDGNEPYASFDGTTITVAPQTSVVLR